MKRSIFCILILCLSAASLSADDYPRNHEIDILHYTFKIYLKENPGIIKGETYIDIRFKNSGVKEFTLDLIGKAEAANDTGMTVLSVTSGDKNLMFEHINNRLKIFLTNPPAEKDRLTFRIDYSGIPGDGLIISRNKFGDRTYFADNWPNRARYWIPTIDHPYEKATCDFIVVAPEQYQVVSNGFQVEETNLDYNMKLTHWKESVPISTKLMVIGVSRFAWEVVDLYKNIPIQTWVFPQNRDDGFYDFERSRRSLEFFDSKIGPFPYEKLANVQSRTRYGGMENASAIFYNENSVSGKRGYENTVVHEIAHQWFGDSVTEADWHHVWLSEGFATYLTHLFNEYHFGRDRLVSGLKRDINRIIRYYEGNPDSPIVDTRITNINRLLSTNSYQKGSWVLHMLRGIIGDEKFFKCLRNYYSQYRDSIAWTEDFQRVAEETSGTELDWFFKQWIYQPGLPKYKGTWEFNKAEGILHIYIEQVQDKKLQFTMPVEIGIYTEDSERPAIEVLKITEINNSFSIKLESEPESVILDPNTWVLMEADFEKKN
ncbi:M1 family metallopeptidase [candidate division KSB1 bacterium]